MFFSDEIYTRNENDVDEIKKYLASHGVNYDYPEKTYVIRDKGKIIATGSVDGNILKYFFTSEEYKGQGTMAIIFNSLLNYLIGKGIDSFFVFTTPDNKRIFKSMGLKEVHSTESVSLFEGGFYNYERWIDGIKKTIGQKQSTRGSIIMNCNPMTLGHKYLIDKALEKVDELIIFLVEEDKSIFPFEDRYSIIKEETKDYDGLKVLASGPYIISQATFPTYFLKEKDSMLEVYTELDGSIFANKIGSDLEIDKRFLGTEPEDMVTSQYNRSLKSILEENQIDVEIIERKKQNDDIISASKVRKLLKDNKLEEAFRYLPESTIAYLKSEKGKTIIKNIS